MKYTMEKKIDLTLDTDAVEINNLTEFIQSLNKNLEDIIPEKTVIIIFKSTDNELIKKLNILQNFFSQPVNKLEYKGIGIFIVNADYLNISDTNTFPNFPSENIITFDNNLSIQQLKDEIQEILNQNLFAERLTQLRLEMLKLYIKIYFSKKLLETVNIETNDNIKNSNLEAIELVKQNNLQNFQKMLDELYEQMVFYFSDIDKLKGN